MTSRLDCGCKSPPRLEDTICIWLARWRESIGVVFLMPRLAPTHLQWIKYREAQLINDVRWRRSSLLDLGQQLEKHLSNWFSAESCELFRNSSPLQDNLHTTLTAQYVIEPNESMFLKWWDYSLLIKVKFELLNCVGDYERSAIVHETLALASQFTEQTEQLAQSGCLLYLQDTTAALLSSLGLTLYQVLCCAIRTAADAQLFPRLELVQKHNTLLMIRSVHRCCTDASAGDASSATAIVARFYRRLVEKLNFASRAPTRRSSPHPNVLENVAQDGPDDPELFPLSFDIVCHYF